ncbi:Myb-like DNA-binding domain containing protein [Tritrichomonas foetus]|uniref:Myb-like DNA-binding domain containing protein n=1 Tax=Tritrichomonas foetus TaxID=1144522 RepID=A0A1J4JQG3_9EUKA|nr:Myb-like DNA-binding domain containing protein [Tritrichomonas foetus]|eukprot:OHS99476.1 Myb-like DNA-binding domain containing protein [Tritrichomonas foetus]
MYDNDIPLIMISKAWIDSSSSSCPPENVEIAKNALVDLINGNISFEMALKIVDESLNSTTQTERVNKILELSKGDSEPLPPATVVNKKCRNWKPWEDDRLLAGIHKFGLGDWKNVSQFVGSDFSRAQCSQRWNRALNPKIEKEVWTLDEQKTLLMLVEKYGEHNWSVVAKNLGKRTDVQCRYRYNQIKKMFSYNPPNYNISNRMRPLYINHIGLSIPNNQTGLMIPSMTFMQINQFSTFSHSIPQTTLINDPINIKKSVQEDQPIPNYTDSSATSESEETSPVIINEEKQSNVSILKLYQNPFYCPSGQLIAPLHLKPLVA